MSYIHPPSRRFMQPSLLADTHCKMLAGHRVLLICDFQYEDMEV